MPNNSFVLDIAAIRRRAQEKMQEGAVTAAYHADPKKVVEVLNEALATELVCVLRYKNHYFTARGISGQTVAEEFLEHAKQEEMHADLIADRITQLGGLPNFNPEGLAKRSHSEYKDSPKLRDLIVQDLVAERIAIESYAEIVRWLGDNDPTSRRIMETILAQEEEHADDLAQLLEQHDANPSKR